MLRWCRRRLLVIVGHDLLQWLLCLDSLFLDCDAAHRGIVGRLCNRLHVMSVVWGKWLQVMGD